LRIYLNDHLAGATAGLELARRTRSENRGTPFFDPISTLASEIDEDRDSLCQMMADLGVPRRSWKVISAWLAEKGARLKLNGSLVGYSPLSRLIELEALLVGVEAKASLWEVLVSVAPSDPRLSVARLEELLLRAVEQRIRLRGLRDQAARIALEA
jgi:hypothetical protein